MEKKKWKEIVKELLNEFHRSAYIEAEGMEDYETFRNTGEITEEINKVIEQELDEARVEELMWVLKIANSNKTWRKTVNNKIVKFSNKKNA